MTKDEALDLALEALEKYCTPYQDGTHPADEAIAAVKQARSVPVQEPVACGACNGSGWIVRDPDIGTDQKCFVCDGAGVPAAPVQEPYKSMSEHIAQATSRRVCIDPITGDVGIGTPAAQSAPVQEPVAWMDVDENGTMYSLRYWSEPDNRNEVALYRAPPNVATPQPAPVQEPVANLTVEDGRVAMAVKILPDGVYDLYTTPPAAQPASQSDGTGGCAMCGAAYEDQVVKAAQPAYEYASEADASESIRVSELPEPLRFADMLDKTMQWPLHKKAADCLRQMYAAQRQPLTDEQIKQIYTEQTGSFIDDSPWALLDFARAIEAAHGIKEKNT